MVSHTANSYDIPTVCEKLTNSHQEPMLLLRGRGVGEGYQGDEVAEQKMDKLEFLVVDTCDLFMTHNCCSNF